MYALAEAFLHMYMYSFIFHKGTKIQLKRTYRISRNLAWVKFSVLTYKLSIEKWHLMIANFENYIFKHIIT